MEGYIKRFLNSFLKLNGFTLIELLIVITIILILASISTAMIVKVSEKARAAACSNNLKQLGMALIMYMDDWDGCLNLNYGEWFNSNFDASYPNYWDYLLYPKYVKTKQVFICPSVLRRLFIPPNYSSYLMNGHICDGPKGKKVLNYIQQDKIVLLTDSRGARNIDPNFDTRLGHPKKPYASYLDWRTTGCRISGYTLQGYYGLHGASGFATDPNNFWYTVFLDGHFDIVKATDYTYVVVKDDRESATYSNPNGKAIINPIDYK
jgi:prepilin-type N-terminal cleavage/methylation domain-containing protein